MGLELGFALYDVTESLKTATWSSIRIAPLPARLAFGGGKRLQTFESQCLSFCCSVARKSLGYLNATERDFFIFHFFIYESQL